MLEASHDVGDYILQKRLGRGDTAELWKAFDTKLQRDVVIKFLLIPSQPSPDFVQHFQQNAHMVASLHHPSIIQIYDIFSHNLIPNMTIRENSPYIVMQYVQGSTLADYIATTSRIGQFPSLRRIVDLFTSLGSALDYAHQYGVPHGNVKPTNVLLDQQNTTIPTGFPILTDFGLRRSWDLVVKTGPYTSALLEALLYVSPEQIHDSQLTNRGDLYSLGIILYEICAGKLPFVLPEQTSMKRSMNDLLQQKRLEPLRPSYINPDISPALEAVILRSVAKEPGERFPDAQALYMALRQVLATKSHKQLKQLENTDIPARASQSMKYANKAAKIHDAAPLPTPSVNESRARSQSGVALLPRKAYSILVRKSFFPPIIGRYKLVSFAMATACLVMLLLLLPFLSSQSFSHGQALGNVVFGQAHFLSSRQGDSTKGQGINDEVQVDLMRLTAPAQGDSYCAWLQGDATGNSNTTLFLGQFTLSQGSAHLIYADPHHSNLLATMSSILVTEEEANTHPAFPPSEKAAWKVFGAISRIPNPRDQNHYSLLDHLRHLLAADPKLDTLNLHGGLSTWLDKNTSLVQELTQKMSSTNDPHQLHLLLVRSLYYLDGIKDVARDTSDKDLVSIDQTNAQIGLLQTHAYQDPPGYLYHAGLHLSGLTTSPGVTPDQQELAERIVSVLDTAESLLEQTRSIAKQLVLLPPEHLLQPAIKSQFVALSRLTAAAYIGQGDDQYGIYWVHQQLPLLAVIPLRIYQS